MDKIHLKFDSIDGSILNGIGESILFSFACDKTPGFKFFVNRKHHIRMKPTNLY